MSFRAELDPENIPRARRQGPIIVLVTLVVMGVSAAGLWAGWRILSHPGAPGPVPVLHADERPVKAPPDDPGGMKVPDQNIYVLNGVRPSEPKVEQLLPPPETPLPRPTPPAIAETPPAAAVAPPEMPAAAAPPAPQATAPEAASPPPPAQPDAAPAAAPPPPPVQQAAAPAVAAPPPPPHPVATPAALPPAAVVHPTTAASGYRLQVGAVRSTAAAQQEWTRLKHANSDLLGALDARAVKADLGERGIFYRIEAGPIADAGIAQRACEQLKQRRVGCILVRP